MACLSFDYRHHRRGQRSAMFGLGYLLLVLLLPACSSSDSSSADSSGVNLAEMITLLPENTRGIVAVDVAALRAAGADTVVSAGVGTAAEVGPFNNPLEVLSHYLRAAGIVEGASYIVLAQTTAVNDGFILLAGSAASTFDVSSMTALENYRQQSIFASGEDGLQLARLRNGLMVVAPEAGLKSVIDVFAGDAADISQGALGPFLGVFAEDPPLGFSYGLPALYAEQVAPGSGKTSLVTARVVTGTLAFESDSFSGKVSFHGDNAATYVDRFRALVGAREAARMALGESGTIDITIPVTAYDTPAEDMRQALGFLKKLVHGMNAVDYADAVIQGGNPPWLNFDVGGQPNSIFINFEFKDAQQIAEFEATELPRGFTLAPIRILDSDEPSYFLVLNIYQSSGGLVSGARAEWSVFVKDPEDGHPRFLVVQAAASEVSADSVNLLTPPEPVEHELQGGAIFSYVGVEDPESKVERNYFTSRITWPQTEERRVGFAREFVAANDYIFWGNGVADRGYYNASVHNRDAVGIASNQIDILDESRWAKYIKPTPKHSYVYLNPLDIVVSPWWNLDADYLDVTDSHRQRLIGFKNSFYPAMVQDVAASAMAGGANALAAFSVGTSVPSIYYYFPITDRYSIDALLGQEFQLARVKLLESDVGSDFYLGLRVYQVDDSPEGHRAEWFTYADKGEGKVLTVILDTFAEDVMPDPAHGLLLPAVVEHRQEDGQLMTRLESLYTRFEASVFSGAGGLATQTLDWVEAGDSVCQPNGVCDKFFYDGQTLEEPVFVIAPSAVNIDRMLTPWDGFIARHPAVVFIRENVQNYAWNPWANVH
ncbi:MAG: hypothetical protein KDI33_17490 [Halioglobus sp.]|nr:hypothetical protein [Halioglobus sp.]